MTKSRPRPTRGFSGLRAVLLFTATLLAAGCSPYPTIGIEPSSLPEGAVGQPYQATLTFSYNAVQGSYVVGNLPAGLMFIEVRNTPQATISGTPTAAGSTTFVVHAYGGQGNFGGPEGQREYTLVVR